MNHVWFVCALGAAILWGLTYTISGRFLQAGVPPPFLVFLEPVLMLPLYFLIAWKTNSIRTGIDIMNANKGFWLLVPLSMMALMGARLMIFTSFSLKNAAVASLIEISYPVFMILFGWLLFGQIQLNLATALGGLLIFSGITLIYLKG